MNGKEKLFSISNSNCNWFHFVRCVVVAPQSNLFGRCFLFHVTRLSRNAPKTANTSNVWHKIIIKLFPVEISPIYLFHLFSAVRSETFHALSSYIQRREGNYSYKLTSFSTANESFRPSNTSNHFLNHAFYSTFFFYTNYTKYKVSIFEYNFFASKSTKK